MRRFFKRAAIVIALFATFCFLNNTNLFSRAEPGRPALLAHRGLAQTFDLTGVENDTCTASRIHPPEHPFLENTLASMEAAFRAGADIVELDIHPTTDGQFAVFHDWTLDCRTDGKGVTRTHPLAQLKALDVGYGYTADGGQSYPFRHKGVGLMPSLDEVLAAFPDKRFLIHIKSNDAAEGETLAARLAQLPPARQRQLAVYGGRLPVAVVRARLGTVKTMSARQEAGCLLTYLALGWTGFVPSSCRTVLFWCRAITGHGCGVGRIFSRRACAAPRARSSCLDRATAMGFRAGSTAQRLLRRCRTIPASEFGPTGSIGSRRSLTGRNVRIDSAALSPRVHARRRTRSPSLRP